MNTSQKESFFISKNSKFTTSLAERFMTNTTLDTHNLIPEDLLETATDLLKSMAHPMRLRILCLLLKKESCVNEILEQVQTSQGNVSQHLGILRDEGILKTTKIANKVYYRVANPNVVQILEILRNDLCPVKN
jgi:DNA-binding transcriptional ArsR family regulator